LVLAQTYLYGDPSPDAADGGVRRKVHDSTCCEPSATSGWSQASPVSKAGARAPATWDQPRLLPMSNVHPGPSGRTRASFPRPSRLFVTYANFHGSRPSQMSGARAPADRPFCWAAAGSTVIGCLGCLALHLGRAEARQGFRQPRPRRARTSAPPRASSPGTHPTAPQA
jgi:hypothetical protein